MVCFKLKPRLVGYMQCVLNHSLVANKAGWMSWKVNGLHDVNNVRVERLVGRNCIKLHVWWVSRWVGYNVGGLHPANKHCQRNLDPISFDS